MFQYKLRSLILLATAIAILVFYSTRTKNEKILPKFRTTNHVVKLSTERDCNSSNLRSLVLETNDEETVFLFMIDSVQLEKSMVEILSKAHKIEQIVFSDCSISTDLILNLDKTPGLKKVTCIDCTPISRPIDNKLTMLQLSFSIDIVRRNGYNLGKKYQ